MCKMNDVKVGIKRLDFGNHRGKRAVYLTDGREVIVPLTMFPDIKNLPMKKRQEWMVLDDQFFTFEHLSNVYSVKDVMRIGQ